MTSTRNDARLLILLSVGQVLGWGLAFYFPVMFASSIAVAVGVAQTEVLWGISLLLLVSAIAAVPAGFILGKYGTRAGMMVGSALLGTSGLILANANSVAALGASAALGGIGAPLALTQAATTVVRERLQPIARTAFALVSIASALSPALLWPPLYWLEPHIGWRGCCLVLSVSILTVGMACNAAVATGGGATHADGNATGRSPSRRTMAMLAVVFGGTGVVTWGLAASLVTALESVGHAQSIALILGATIGPAQVLGRLLDTLLADRLHVVSVGAISLCMMLAGTLFLGTYPNIISIAWAGALSFAVGAGAFTIVRSMLAVSLLKDRFAVRLGYLSAAQNISVAAGPFVVAVLISSIGVERAFLACGSIILVVLLTYTFALSPHEEP